MIFARAAPKVWLMAFYSCAVVVLALASMPPAKLLPGTGWDKSDHVTAFLVLGLLGLRAHPSAQMRCCYALLGFGVGIELLQAVLPYRNAEWQDVVADAVGLSLAYALPILAPGAGAATVNAQIAARLLSLPRSIRQALAIAMDATISLGVVWLAFGLCLGTWGDFGSAQWRTAAWTIGLALPVFHVSGVYRALHRHDSGAILGKASLWFGAMFMVLLPVIGVTPWALGVLVPGTLFLVASVARSAVRRWLAYATGASRRRQGAKPQASIYRAGDAGRRVEEGAKRAFDLVVSIVALVAFAPFALVLALLCLLAHGRPIFFRQERVGREGSPFYLRKFRSMRDAFDEHGQPLPDEQRVTTLGRAMRRFRVDELPGFWAVATGKMSVVGPRPLPATELATMAGVDERNSVRPGCTGLAQVSGNTLLSNSEKAALDVFYVRHWSLGMDVAIFFKTWGTILRGESRNERLIAQALREIQIRAAATAGAKEES